MINLLENSVEINGFFSVENNVKNTICRIIENPLFNRIIRQFFSREEGEKIIFSLKENSNIIAFQKQFMHPFIRKIIEKTSFGLSCSGFENICPDTPFLFISNHRDIFLDSAILNILLMEHGLQTTQITSGNNLISHSLIADMVSINKMVTVFREGSNRLWYQKEQLLSGFIQQNICGKNTSVWIAQRNGRTKDGYDKTQISLLKMLTLSRENSVYEAFQKLNLVPVSVSYEYEPCDYLKVQEIYNTQNGSYKKSSNEDLHSIIRGITQQKGNIHLSIGTPLNQLLLPEYQWCTPKELYCDVAKIIDKQIVSNCRLWPENFIACDLLHEQKKYSHLYTSASKEMFKTYMEGKVALLKGNPEVLRKLFLQLYSGPVFNKEKYQSIAMLDFEN